MIAATVAEGTVASPATETNLDSKQQPSFCEANHSSDSNNNNNNNTSSPAYKDVEDTFQGNGIPQMSEVNDNSSYWALFLKAYVPLIMIWFRKSMFGPANLVRTMVVGQVMKWVVSGDFHEILSKKFPRLEAILFPPTNGKLDPHAWPPPAFTALALLTVLALVVHPDGLTWVLLGKLRDAIFAFFRALGQSLEFLLNDYGVFPTIIAATTLAAMFFLVFVVIRTLSPKPQKMDKQQQQQHNNTLSNNERKKKKKKGNARHRNNHRSNRIKQTRSQQQQQQQQQPEVVDTTTTTTTTHMESAENDTPEASPCSPIPSPPPLEEVSEDTLSSPTLAPETSVENSLEAPSLSATSSADNMVSSSSSSSSEPVKEPISEKLPIPNGTNKPLKEAAKESKARRRMMSGSTMDTTPLSDDQSCGSVSVRSFPSVSVNSNRSGSGKKNNPKNSSSTPRRLKRHGNNVKSPKNVERNNSGRKHKNNNSNSISISTSSVDSSVTSRWDALKPEQGGGGKHNNHKGNNNHNSNSGNAHHNHANTPNRKHNQQRNRNNNNNHRRGPNGRKGRGHSKRHGSRSPMREHGVSPRNFTRPDLKEESYPSNPFADSNCPSLPAPPPGFKKASHSNNDFEPSQYGMQQQPQPQPQQPQMNHNLFEAPYSSPQNNSVTGVSPEFFRGTNAIEENPFRSNVQSISGSSLYHSSNNNYNSMSQHHQANMDSQIEADLQELGGQMAGSILDF